MGKRVVGLVVGALVLAVSALGLAIGPLASSGATGTLECPNFNDNDVPTPPAGQTGYLFIGTSISTNASSITVTFTAGGVSGQTLTVPGVQEGNGAFHYIVDLPQGAVVTAASVIGATEHTVITVSGCLNGPPVTTVPPTTVPPTTVPPTTVPPTTVPPTTVPPTTVPPTTTPPTTVPPTTRPPTPTTTPPVVLVPPLTVVRPARPATPAPAPVTVTPRTTG